MKKTILFLLLIAGALGAQDAPITYFGWNTYLGGGNYEGPNGETGTTHSMIQTQGTSIFQNTVIGNNYFQFTGDFDFDDNGRFDFFLTRQTNFDNQSTAKTKVDGKPNIKEEEFEGQGYCFASGCHLEADSDTGTFEETIIFNNQDNTVHKIGSSEQEDDAGNSGLTTWEEDLVMIGSGDEDSTESDDDSSDDEDEDEEDEEDEDEEDEEDEKR